MQTYNAALYTRNAAMLPTPTRWPRISPRTCSGVLHCQHPKHQRTGGHLCFPHQPRQKRYISAHSLSHGQLECNNFLSHERATQNPTTYSVKLPVVSTPCQRPSAVAPLRRDRSRQSRQIAPRVLLQPRQGLNINSHRRTARGLLL